MNTAAAPERVTPPSNFNIANVLTCLRIVMVPVFGWLILSDAGRDGALRWWSLGVFVIAMATDRLDGELARSRNLVTDFGKLADPIADKALTGMAFIGLSLVGDLWWWVTVVVLVREIGITVLRFVVLRYGVMPASRGGKLKTALQALGLAIFIAPVASTLWLWLGYAVMAAAVAVTVGTAFDYVLEARRLVRHAAADGARDTRL